MDLRIFLSPVHVLFVSCGVDFFPYSIIKLFMHTVICAFFFGRTHGSEFQMWEEGRNATLGVKVFAEEGDSSQLNIESVQGYGDILDNIAAPPVNRSVGQTSTVIFLDGHHSKMSFMMRIIPSPDWFIGVSSLDLCAHGRWKNKIHVELHPFDAGTDQGLTFTAPNWPNTPALPISAITSSFPDHPASSFFYPEYEELPRLAYLDLDIVSEFRHRETFMKVPHHYQASTAENDEADKGSKAGFDELSTTTVKEESKPLKHHSVIYNKPGGSSANDKNEKSSVSDNISAAKDVQDPSNASSIKIKDVQVLEINSSSLKTKRDKDDQIHLHGDSKATHLSTTRKTSTLNDLPHDTAAETTLEETSTRYTTQVQDGNSLDHSTQTRGGSTGHTEGGGLGNRAETNHNESSKEDSRTRYAFRMGDLLRGPAALHLKSNSSASTPETKSIFPAKPDGPRIPEASIRHLATMHGTSAVDCEVGDWSEWSSCSQTCGFGQQERTRNVSSYPQNGGANCPRLRQTNWCGSMRSCQWNHFSFLEPGVTQSKRQLREGLTRRRITQRNKMPEKIR